VPNPRSQLPVDLENAIAVISRYQRIYRERVRRRTYNFAEKLYFTDNLLATGRYLRRIRRLYRDIEHGRMRTAIGKLRSPASLRELNPRDFKHPSLFREDYP